MTRDIQSDPSSIESTPPSGGSNPPSSQSIPPSTQSIPPSTQSIPPSTQSIPPSTQSIPPSQARDTLRRIEKQVAEQIVGQSALVEKLIISLLANGHALLEGVPGLAKTKTLTTLAASLSATMRRVQFTPDLLPSDLIGTEVYRPQTADFVVRKGPVFTNILLADEINRAPAKVQSALLQAMQEREVSIGEVTYQLPNPFLVLATQNPLEQEGTYPLPEAQLDRFLLKVVVAYPSFEEEVLIIKQPAQQLLGSCETTPVIDLGELALLRESSALTFVDDRVDRYMVSLVHATRNGERYGLKGLIEWGASPRASIALKAASRALAYMRGNAFVTPDEVKDIAPDVLRHRIIPTFEAEARGVTVEQLIAALLKGVVIP
jgi:MoxR-like ATPase